ncbi:MAG: Gfo/Idh/MocA family oxidoreductase [Kiritimatiellae bacterium]|nr:Gfo/Idh/MocA family oxidoreductase [Kiritimatiellia bacterium]
MIGGGMHSFMGAIHRAAIEKAGLRLACGVFGSTRQSSYDSAREYGLSGDAVMGQYRDILRRQGRLKGDAKALFATVLAPNVLHYPVTMAAMDNGLGVLCEKPFTCTLDEALNLARKQRALGLPYRIAMVYPAYSQLVKARKLIRDGALGTLRRFDVCLQQGWMARRVENQGVRSAMWRTEKAHSGKGGVITEMSCHCQFALEWVTGLEIESVCAVAKAVVPGRMVADDAAVFVKTASAPAGVFRMSTVAVGHTEGLSFEITGDAAAMFWRQDRPGELRIVENDGTERILKDRSLSGEGESALVPFGANAAYVEALSRVYSDFRDEINGTTKKIRKSGERILGMTIEEGVRSVAVAEAIERSAAETDGASKWVQVERTGI